MTGLIPLVWILLGFLSGSLPFSLWIGRLAMGRDIRSVGDGNPGAMNVFRAGGKGWGWLAILLDFLKGALPVSIAALGLELEGAALAAAALAPIAGHAFSPFLRFRGGKAIAATFGAWAGLSLWVVPAILGGLYAALRPLLKNDRLSVLAGQAGLLIALLFLQPDWTWFAVWAGSTAIFALKFSAPSR